MRRRAVRSADRMPRDYGTPETQAKLEPDWALELNPEQQFALDRIRAAYQIMTIDCRMRISDLAKTDKSISHETPGEITLQEMYSKWWVRCSGRGWGMARLHGLIVDPLSTRAQVSPVLGLIAKALDEYARIR